MDVIFDPSHLQRRTAVLAQYGRKVRMQLVTNFGSQKPFATLSAENQMHQDTGQGLGHSRSPFRIPRALHISRSRNIFYLEGRRKIARSFRPHWRAPSTFDPGRCPGLRESGPFGPQTPSPPPPRLTARITRGGFKSRNSGSGTEFPIK